MTNVMRATMAQLAPHVHAMLTVLWLAMRDWVVMAHALVMLAGGVPTVMHVPPTIMVLNATPVLALLPAHSPVMTVFLELAHVSVTLAGLVQSVTPVM